MRALLRLLALVVPATAPAQAPRDSRAARVTIAVTDSAGAPIPTARVYVGSADSARVDPFGRAQVRVRPGLHLVWATSMGFAPVARRVLVARDTTLVLVLSGAPDAPATTPGPRTPPPR